GPLAPKLTIPRGIKGETLSRDPSVAAKTVDDPLCVTFTTTRFGAAAGAEQARVRALAHRGCPRPAPGGFGSPAPVPHGEDDRLVPASASEPFEGAPLIERRTYPDLRHELH